jgi:hypothetical protein
MRHALVEGFRRMARAPGLVLLVYSSNVLFAALLALPLAGALESSLRGKPGVTLGSGPFWADWTEHHGGWMSELSPEILGSGGFFLATERLLGGTIPGGAFASLSGLPSAPVDGVVLGLGLVYLLVQAFLTGGLLGTYRALRGTWSPNGFFHGSAFYFGRMVRAGLVGLVFAALAFALHAPLGRWLAAVAREARSETTALLLGFLSHAVLLGLLLFLSTVTAYCRVIVVAEERRSAALAFLSALVFSCGRSFTKAFGHSLTLAALVALLALGWARLDALAEPSLLALLALGQVFVVTRVSVRLAALAGRYALYTRAAGRN